MFYPVVHVPPLPALVLLKKLLSSLDKAPPRPRSASRSSLHKAQHQSIDVDLTRCTRFLVGWSTDEGMYASDYQTSLI